MAANAAFFKLLDKHLVLGKLDNTFNMANIYQLEMSVKSRRKPPHCRSLVSGVPRMRALEVWNPDSQGKKERKRMGSFSIAIVREVQRR